MKVMNNDFKKNRILLLAPDDYKLYVSVQKNLVAIGFEVVTILNSSVKFKYKNIFQRLYKSIRKVLDGNNSYKKNLILEYTVNNLIQLISEQTHFDYCLVFRSDFFHNNVLKYAKEKSDFMVSYHYDGLKRNPIVFERISIFDKFYVFDEEDVLSGEGLKTYLSHNFYFDYYEESADPIFNVYFLGYYNKSREYLLLEFFEIAQKIFDKVKFEIVFPPEHRMRISEYKSKGLDCLLKVLPFEEYLKNIEQSEIIVDFLIGEHRGLSFRIFEGIKFKKKVITTNQNVIKYDFYNTNNFYILNSESLDEKALSQFVNNQYVPLEEGIREKYSFSTWINEILIKN